MKFGDIQLEDWEAFGPIFIKQGFKKSSNIKFFLYNAPITLTKEYPPITSGHPISSRYTWKPSFCNELQYLQKVYDDTIGDKKFGRNEEKLAMDYIDQFLIRMNKLRVFI